MKEKKKSNPLKKLVNSVSEITLKFVCSQDYCTIFLTSLSNISFSCSNPVFALDKLLKYRHGIKNLPKSSLVYCYILSNILHLKKILIIILHSIVGIKWVCTIEVFKVVLVHRKVLRNYYCCY